MATPATAPHADWIVPDWPVPPNVRALCTTRQGGVSPAPYDSLNLGLHVADDAARVHLNRRILADTVGGRPVFLHQVHGAVCTPLGTDAPDGTEADACTVTTPGTVCTIMVADCLPVLLAAADGSRVAAAHAGWRGLVGQWGYGVLEAALEPFFKPFTPLAQTDASSVAPEIIAWLGPCIGPAAFEVGDEVRAAFVAALPAANVCFQPLGDGKWLADLPALARQRLRAAGVRSIWGNDGSAAWCTVGNPLRFFSHRRDRVSGRQAACIWLE